jgi:hypothetical protein
VGQAPKTGSLVLPRFPENLLGFQRMFPDEAACLRYLEQVRWPGGFVCAACEGAGEPQRITGRGRVLRCRLCRHETSVTAGTVMHRSKTDLHVWFWAAFLVATSTPGVSALEIQKKLGMLRYETAFQLMHKLRAAMVRPNQDKIGGEWPIEMDITFVGGKCKGRQGKSDKAPVIIAVEVRRREIRAPRTGKILEHGLAGRIRLRQTTDKSAGTLAKFANDWIVPSSILRTDDGPEFASLAALGYTHQAVATHSDGVIMDAWLPIVSTVTGNLKAWIDGTFHGVSRKHLQTYLNEFMFRFNRRFWRQVSFRNLLGLAVAQAGPTYQGIYDGKWHHRADPATPATARDASGVATG